MKRWHVMLAYVLSGIFLIAFVKGCSRDPTPGRGLSGAVVYIEQTRKP